MKKLNFVFLLTSVFLFLIVAEFVAWLTYDIEEYHNVIMEHQSASARILEDSRLIYDLKPNFRGYVTETLVELNSMGFRDYDFSFKKDDGVKRILFLGDSITFGYALKKEQTFEDIIEQRLRDRQENYEVINAGIPGYNTVMHYFSLKEKGMKYEPDIIIMQFTINDLDKVQFLDIEKNGKKVTYWSEFEEKNLIKTPVFNKLNTKLIDISYSYRFVNRKITIILNKFNIKYNLYREGREDFTKALVSINNFAKKNDIDFLFVIFPDILYNERYLEDIKYVRDTVKRYNIQTLDLTEAFRNKRIQDMMIDAFHPNVAGNELAAEEIYNYIEEKGII